VKSSNGSIPRRSSLSTQAAIGQNVDLNQQLRMKMGFSAKAVDSYELLQMLKERKDAIGRLRYKINLLLEGTKIDSLIGVVILANSISIGVQINFELEGRDTAVFESLEYAFVTIYSIELGLRFFASRWLCFKSGWVKFDAFLIGMSYFSLALEPMLKGRTNLPVGFIGVLKMLRLLCLLRAVRLVGQFRMLWELVRGLLESITMILTTVVLMTFILYIYACIGLELVTKEKDGYEGDALDLIEYNFGSVFNFMVSLIQFATFDSSAAIYTPVIFQNWLMLPYFVSYMLVVGVVLTNLLTAVGIECSFEASRTDKEVE